MIAIITLTLLLALVGPYVRTNAQCAMMAFAGLLACIVCDPSLLAAHPLAHVATFAWLLIALIWLYPVALHGVKPGRLAWITPRFVVVVAYV